MPAQRPAQVATSRGHGHSTRMQQACRQNKEQRSTRPNICLICQRSRGLALHVGRAVSHVTLRLLLGAEAARFQRGNQNCSLVKNHLQERAGDDGEQQG